MIDHFKIGSLVLCTSLFMASSPASAQCAKDTDCKGDRVCEAGRCVGSSASRGDPVPPARPPTTEANSTRVSFVSGENDPHYLISIAGRTCSTPCSMAVKPGAHQLFAQPNEGKGFGTFVLVPDSGGIFRVSQGRRPALAAGIALTTIGAVVASSLWAAALGCRGDSGCAVFNLAFWPVVGGSMFFTGVGLLGYGATHAVPRGAELVSGATIGGSFD